MTDPPAPDPTEPPPASVGRDAWLLDGTAVTVRPIGASDGPALVRFHEGLSDETTRLRFFTRHPVLTAREVARFTQVDHRDREALVMEAFDQLIAVGRYDRAPGSPEAEVAFVVGDAWQGHGAATLLFGALADQARRVGVARFVADTLADNHTMLDVFEHTGLVVGRQVDCGVVHVTLDLARGLTA